MAAGRKSKRRPTPKHRGRIQAQGGGVEKSVSWNRQTPPTESEMMAMVSQLESQLTPAERGVRARAFEQLRRLIRNGSIAGSLPRMGVSFPHLSERGIRVDLEVFKGEAGVPDPKHR